MNKLIKILLINTSIIFLIQLILFVSYHSIFFVNTNLYGIVILATLTLILKYLFELGGPVLFIVLNLYVYKKYLCNSLYLKIIVITYSILLLNLLCFVNAYLAVD